MAWFEDLSSCSYFGDGVTPYLRAVGWLEDGEPFTTGVADSRVIERLVEIKEQGWHPVMFFGFHLCDLCPDGKRTSGSQNLFIPGQGIVYVAPAMILHYMESHGYAPPAAFCCAVLDCPPAGSKEYFAALRGTGIEAEWHVPDGSLEDRDR